MLSLIGKDQETIFKTLQSLVEKGQHFEIQEVELKEANDTLENLREDNLQHKK